MPPSNIFLDISPWARETKEKGNKWYCTTLKRFSQWRKPSIKWRDNLLSGEKTFVNATFNKKLIQLNTKKSLWFKNGQWTWTDISLKRTHRWPWDMKKRSTSLIIREIQIKTTMKYYLTPVRMAVIGKWTKKSVDEDVEKGNPSALWVGMQTGAAPVESSVEGPQKIRQSCHRTQQFHCWVFVQIKPLIWKGIPKHPYVHRSIVYNGQDTEAAQVSTGRWVDEEGVVYTQWSTTWPSKIMKSCHLRQHGWTGGYYAKWSISQGRTNIV